MNDLLNKSVKWISRGGYKPGERTGNVIGRIPAGHNASAYLPEECFNRDLMVIPARFRHVLVANYDRMLIANQHHSRSGYTYHAVSADRLTVIDSTPSNQATQEKDPSQ